MTAFEIPEVPASAGALLRDLEGKLLIVNPTYKSGWGVPGGIMEDNGESPWDACRREVLEETGIVVTSGRLVCVDTRPGKNGDKLGLRFLFDCGTLADKQIRGIRLQAEELSEYRFVAPEDAVPMLSKPVRRRVREVLASRGRFVYLENGRRVDGVN